MRLDKYLKEQRVLDLFTFFMFVGLSMISMGVQANFATPNITSPDNTCPIDHKKYPLSNSSVNDGPALSQWKDKDTSKSFSFPDPSTGDKELFISFTNIFDSVDNTPFYRNSYEDTRNSLNMTHNSNIDSSVIENHVININVNKPVSKIGYKIQDLDTDANIFVTFYLERAKAIKGLLSRVSKYHDPVDTSNGNNTVTTKNNTLDCGPNDCTIDAAWGYTPANTQLSLIHSNAKTTAPFQNRLHTVGYSDFYFCLAPPKIIVNKALNDNRVNPTDQFKIEIIQTNQPTVQPLGTFTTTGSNSSVNNNTTNAVTLKEKTNYTITERVLGGGDISRYTASYECTNATTGSPSVIPRGNMMFNANNNTRSFTLSNLNYADEITCTITNTPATLTFSGRVFNDNGGIDDSKANALNGDITSGVYANKPDYFNGIFNSATETGISGSIIDLTDCSGTVYTSQTVAPTGLYSLTATTVQTKGNTTLCLVERRTDSNFSIRSTDGIKTRTITANNDNYPDNNFGRVIAANAALVLTKYQYVNDCSNFDYKDTSINAITNSNPRNGFATETITDTIDPNQCIAYKITATNRANLAIDNFILSDVLQQKGVNSANATSIRVAPNHVNPNNYNGNSVGIGLNGTVQTKPLVLPKRSKTNFYFNTQYIPNQ